MNEKMSKKVYYEANNEPISAYNENQSVQIGKKKAPSENELKFSTKVN